MRFVSDESEAWGGLSSLVRASSPVICGNGCVFMLSSLEPEMCSFRLWMMAENSSHNGQLSLRFSCMGLAPQFLMMQHKSLLAIVYLSRTLLHVGMRGVGDHHMLCPQTIFGLWVP